MMLAHFVFVFFRVSLVYIFCLLMFTTSLTTYPNRISTISFFDTFRTAAMSANKGCGSVKHHFEHEGLYRPIELVCNEGWIKKRGWIAPLRVNLIFYYVLQFRQLSLSLSFCLRSGTILNMTLIWRTTRLDPNLTRYYSLFLASSLQTNHMMNR